MSGWLPNLPPVMWTAYSSLMLVSILATAGVWWHLSRRRGSALTGGSGMLVYAGGLLGAFVGAKVSFLVAEGWAYAGDALALWSGKSVTGALLGGYAGVEIAKRLTGRRAATGDGFALLVPLALALGRVGCLLQGCCPGVRCESHWWTIDRTTRGVTTHHWPAAAAELAFNVLLFGWVLIATARGWRVGNRFHVYLVCYGVFRFAHEFAREGPRIIDWPVPIGGYHVLAVVIAGLGAWRMAGRDADGARAVK